MDTPPSPLPQPGSPNANSPRHLTVSLTPVTAFVDDTHAVAALSVVVDLIFRYLESLG
jgi:hypothetical protein